MVKSLMCYLCVRFHLKKCKGGLNIGEDRG